MLVNFQQLRTGVSREYPDAMGGSEAATSISESWMTFRLCFRMHCPAPICLMKHASIRTPRITPFTPRVEPWHKKESISQWVVESGSAKVSHKVRTGHTYFLPVTLGRKGKWPWWEAQMQLQGHWANRIRTYRENPRERGKLNQMQLSQSELSSGKASMWYYSWIAS